MASQVQPPPLQTARLHPGMRIAVACSGGADSVALLLTLLDRRSSLGIVLSMAHMNHGIRGAEADADQAFVEALAARFDLPCHLRRVDTPAAVEAGREGLEEAARNLRYAWFRELLANGDADAIVTAHTLDDQAETVLHRLIRGAWTEGLGGIFPVLEAKPTQPGTILRPFLETSRHDIEEYLQSLRQPWREDSTNRDTAFTRNRLRHELLPQLADYNPGIKSQLARVATIARDEEAYWQAELARLLPSLLLSGKAVRGGGRATSTLAGDRSLAIEIERLRGLHPALRRRVLRAAASQLGVPIDFDDTDRLLNLCGFAEETSPKAARTGLKIQLERGLRAERTPRELRLYRADPDAALVAPRAAEYSLPIPGSVDAPAFGLRLEATLGRPAGTPLPEARLRSGRAGDRVFLRHSRSPLKIQEARQRSRLPPDMGAPVLEWQGEIVWMPEVAIESDAARTAVLSIVATPLTRED